ncbi:MAG TPA: hypothetical protein VFF67_00770 [Thermoplasmata archaeon]|nr:hypothetical protein [Thermoplasmata archaeon]
MGFDSSTLANIAIAASAVVAVGFGIVQVLVAVRDRRERLTIEVVRAFQTREFAEAAMELRERPPPRTATDWAALPESTRAAHLHFLQQMEMLGMLVFDRTIEIDLVERTLGSYVTATWKKFEPSVLELRVQQKDPYLSEFFQYLGEHMERWMRERPRTPAYRTADGRIG